MEVIFDFIQLANKCLVTLGMIGILLKKRRRGEGGRGSGEAEL